MDTLFTTFCSPGMAPSVWPLEDSLLGKCLVDVTNWPSSKNDSMSSLVISGEQFVKRISKSATGSGYWNELPNMYIETPYIMYFQTLPTTHCEFAISNCTNKYIPTTAQSKAPLGDYFLNQLHRLAVNKRIATALQDMLDICTESLFCNKRKIKKNLSNKNSESATGMQQNIDTDNAVSVTAETACPCDKQETGDRFCQSHQLFIQDMVTTKRTCAWNIYFSVNGSHDSMMVTVEDDYCVNPCYDELCENLLDDSFEIEFSTTTLETCDDLESSIDSIDFGGVHLACESYDTCGGEIFDIYDEDEDCDEYDDGSLCEIFNSELHIAPTWSHGVIMTRQRNSSQSQDCFNIRKEVSKYHKHCVSSRRNSYTNSDNYTHQNIHRDFIDGKQQKKHVHFPEEDKELVTVHKLVAWSHAYKQSRRSEWLRCAQDRAHFRRRIMKLSDIIEPVLREKISQFDTF